MIKTRETIVKELVDAVKEVAGERYQVRTDDFGKNNGIILQAIVIHAEGEDVSPTIYIDKFVEDIKYREKTVEEVAGKIFKIYEENRNPKLSAEISELSKKEFILDHVEYQLVNADRNEERLSRVPSKKVADLAALYRTVISDDANGIASFVVTNAMMDIAGISIEELDEAAVRNTNNAGFTMRSMQQEMAEMMGMSEEMAEVMKDGPDMFVLTNRRKINGASILLFIEKLEELAEKLEDDFFILPSSIHELLAIPVSQANVDELKKIVQEVNDTKVEPDEILGYKVYRYNHETGEVEVAA